MCCLDRHVQSIQNLNELYCDFMFLVPCFHFCMNWIACVHKQLERTALAFSQCSVLLPFTYCFGQTPGVFWHQLDPCLLWGLQVVAHNTFAKKLGSLLGDQTVKKMFDSVPILNGAALFKHLCGFCACWWIVDLFPLSCHLLSDLHESWSAVTNHWPSVRWAAWLQYRSAGSTF